MQRIEDIEGGDCVLKYDDDGRFEAAAFAPCATQNACQYIRHIVGLDACNTKSKYRMMLLICTGKPNSLSKRRTLILYRH
jgi:hypothetical protein